MSSIPETCLAYTQVFQTLRIELVVSIVIGVAIGYFFDRIGK